MKEEFADIQYAQIIHNGLMRNNTTEKYFRNQNVKNLFLL